ncbi:MAG: two-component regulator propeller domain-containing protein [Chitinophagaceae bacterium]
MLLLQSVAQSPSFFHLTTASGLPDNNIRSLLIDKRGFLWIGTIEGLSMFDGYRVTSYYKDRQDRLPSNNIIHLSGDSAGNIWIATPDGISWLDEMRQFHRVFLQDSIAKFPARTIQETKKYGPVLFTGLGQYWHNQRSGKWERLDWIPQQLSYAHFIDAEKFNDDTIIYAMDSLVMLLDYATGKIVFQSVCKDVNSVCRYSDNAIAIALKSGLILIKDISSGNTLQEFRIDASINEIRPAANGAMLVATADDGFAVISSGGRISQYLHDPVEKGSLGSNNVSRIICSPDGDVIIGSRIAGLSTYNIYNLEAGYTSIFNDGNGHFYDNFISKIAEGDSGVLWLGAYEQIIRWDKANNRSRFYPYARRNGRPFEIRTLCVDKKGRVWAGTLGDGIAVLNQKTGEFIHRPTDSTASNAQRSKTVVTLYTATDGTIWVSTVAGTYTIDPVSGMAHDISVSSALNEIAGKRVNVFFEDGRGQLWMATHDAGLYRYHFSSGKLRHFTMADGLAADQVFGLCADSRHNLYAGCSLGFSVISSNDSIQTYTKSDGLRFDRCDGILEDSLGHLWISNVKYLFMFNPFNKTMKMFGLNSGLSPDGFRVGSLLKTSSGELIWGSRKGINYFFPEQLAEFSAKLKVNIYAADLQDTTVYVTGANPVRMRYANNNIIFRFTAIDLQGSSNILYRFMLENYDKSWQEGTDIREARYSSLQPGTYDFKVMASGDGINWIPAMDSISLNIIPPFWQRSWFIVIAVLLFAAAAASVIYRRLQKLERQRDLLEIEQSIGVFVSGISDLHSEKAIVAYLEQYCRQKIHFSSCVINEGEQPLTGVAVSVPVKYEEKILGYFNCGYTGEVVTRKQHILLTRLAGIFAPRIVRIKVLVEKQEADAMLADTQKKMTEIEMQALRAQMNPHFIFNCLNSINRYIVKSDQVTASLYLTKFAKLIRLILDNSNSKNVLLSNELEALRLYIEMEALRFDKKFSYDIYTDNNITTDCIEVPPLIIQPYVENAIWHGLLHKENSGHLQIRLQMAASNLLQCIIEDNGIGRKKAKELKSKTAVTRKSLGMELTENRLKLLNKYTEENAMIEIVDMETDAGMAAGTKVIISIPV